jgi:uncharacterized protein (DUF952 family)
MTATHAPGGAGNLPASGLIYHMLPAARWAAQPPDQPYTGDTLATEGFIHCTAEAERLLAVANAFHRAVPGPHVILCIRAAAVTAEVRWEAADGHVYPHIYGPLNLDAVAGVLAFPRAGDGTFLSPPAFQAAAARSG